MSAQPITPDVPPDHVAIEINGQTAFAPKGSMIIQAADRLGIAIPRFCYHEKLPIAANCRMCMVEVEMGGKPMPKPQPACATPVADGMKIFTQSERALSAQRNVMEFLLINHPLDCPICDQGGECELQDLSVGYGRSVSRFVERKRTIPDEDLGPLVATEMTRCIHCTRCVRVMAEVAGTYELGGMERGERLQIGTHVGKPLMSELSGNVIDVCPVGALTNKPFRFRARAWELLARESIGYHDALGSNLWLHVRRGEALRAVPRDNDRINECWLSDRDRYSCEGLRAPDRAERPMIRRNGELVETSWTDALSFVADGLRQAGGDLGALVAPSTSSEEGHLLAQLLRALGSTDIDHRLRVQDRHDREPARPFEMAVADVEHADVVVLIGCDPRREMPLLGHRLRKAAKRGAKVHVIDSLDVDLAFEPTSRSVVLPQAIDAKLLTLAAAAGAGGMAPMPADLVEATRGVEVDASARDLVDGLRAAQHAVVILGEGVSLHPAANALRASAAFIARATRSALNAIPAGANAIGLARAGAMPGKDGRGAADMLASPPKHLLVYHAGSQDTANPAAFDRARSDAQFCVYIGAYACTGVRRTAHAVLPIGLPPEIDGSFTNVDGIVQRFAPAAKLPGDAKPGWKVLRSLGAALALPGFDFMEFDELHARLANGADAPRSETPARRSEAVGARFQRIATTAIYRSDAVVRRSAPLQAHPLNRPATVVVHPEDALALGVADGAAVRVEGVTLPVAVSLRVPRGGAWIEAGHAVQSALPPHGAALTIERA